jgi:hypothetical protein
VCASHHPPANSAAAITTATTNNRFLFMAVSFLIQASHLFSRTSSCLNLSLAASHLEQSQNFPPRTAHNQE